MNQVLIPSVAVLENNIWENSVKSAKSKGCIICAKKLALK